MDINYTFILKKTENSSFNVKEQHLKFLEAIFPTVGMDFFKVKYNEEDYQIDYKIYYNKSLKMFKLLININEENEYLAVLDYVNKQITKTPKRKDYHIITTYDGLSEYYTNTIYSSLNKFERTLRELVYNILIEVFGIQWYKKTINQDLDGKLKSSSKKSEAYLIENALQEMTMQDMEDYLFKPYKELDIDQKIESGEINEDFISRASREQIQFILLRSIPKSLWERFFKDIIVVEDIQAKLKSIRVHRNKVAHGKTFHKEDYDNCKDILEDVLSEIYRALEEINRKEIDSEYLYNTYLALEEFVKLKYTTNSLSDASKALQSALTILPEVQKQIKVLQSPLTISPEVQTQFKALQNPLTISPEEQEQQ